MAEVPTQLPPGWEFRLDNRTNRYYFVNHLTKITTWDDPRLRFKTGNSTQENIPMQHGSPETRRNYVYPSQTHPQPAFQIPAHYSPKNIPRQELSNSSTMRTSSPSVIRNTQLANVMSRFQETSLSASVTDVEQSVSKISTMFPTVSQTHIKLLLKKYMKSLFPKADETILLEVMACNDNNVQRTSEALLQMGYEKKEKTIVKSPKTDKSKVTEETRPKETPPPRMKTSGEKNQMKTTLQSKYTDTPEQLITLALESADYDQERAGHILELMLKEETDKKNNSENSETQDDDIIEESPTSVKLSKSITSLMTPSPSIRTLQADKMDPNKVFRVREKKNSFRPILELIDKDERDYKSSYLIKTAGPNAGLAKGSDNKMLLDDYITWDGPDPHLRNGSRPLAKGPNSSLLSKRSYQACGPNSDLRKGPTFSIAKISSPVMSHSRCGVLVSDF